MSLWLNYFRTFKLLKYLQCFLNDTDENSMVIFNPNSWDVVWTTLSCRAASILFCMPSTFHSGMWQCSPGPYFTMVPIQNKKHYIPIHMYSPSILPVSQQTQGYVISFIRQAKHKT